MEQKIQESMTAPFTASHFTSDYTRDIARRHKVKRNYWWSDCH